MSRNPKFIAFVVALALGLYFLLTGSLILGLVLLGLAVMIPAA